ncbi:MAG: hypothetical protein QF464_02065, partial [Myxococcota bacterium]|nr:hypothetical protein [Myxococcota bacterium]
MSDLPKTENAFFRRWAEFVLAHRLLCLALVLLVTAGAVYQTKRHLRVDMDIEAFLEGKSDTRASLGLGTRRPSLSDTPRGLEEAGRSDRLGEV